MDMSFREVVAEDGQEWMVVDHEETEVTLAHLQSETKADALACSNASSMIVTDASEDVPACTAGEPEAAQASTRGEGTVTTYLVVCGIAAAFLIAIFPFAPYRMAEPAVAVGTPVALPPLPAPSALALVDPAATVASNGSVQLVCAAHAASQLRSQRRHATQTVCSQLGSRISLVLARLCPHQVERPAVEFSLNHTGLLCAVDTRRFLVGLTALTAFALGLDVVVKNAFSAAEATTEQGQPQEPKGTHGMARKRGACALTGKSRAAPAALGKLPDATATRPRPKPAAAPIARRLPKPTSPAPAHATVDSVFASLNAASLAAKAPQPQPSPAR